MWHTPCLLLLSEPSWEVGGNKGRSLFTAGSPDEGGMSVR